MERGGVGDVAGDGDTVDVVRVGGDHVQCPAHHRHQDGEVGAQLCWQRRWFYAAFKAIKYFPPIISNYFSKLDLIPITLRFPSSECGFSIQIYNSALGFEIIPTSENSK